MAERLRVVLADSRAAVRSALRILVEGRWGWRVVGEAGDALEAVRIARERRPDAVLLDGGRHPIPLDEVTAMLEAVSVVPVLLLESPLQHSRARGVAVLKGVPGSRIRQVIVDEAQRLARTGGPGR